MSLTRKRKAEGDQIHALSRFKGLSKEVEKCYNSWAEWAPSPDPTPFPEMLDSLVAIFKMFGHDTEVFK